MSILLDHPTRAKTAAPNPLLLLPVVLMLRKVLERRGEVTLRLADLSESPPGNVLGLTHFPTSTVYVDEDVDDATFRWVLVHELMHVVNGPPGGPKSTKPAWRPASRP